MAPKRATFYTFSDDTGCEEIRKFISDSSVILTVRNIDENPLSVKELKALIGHIDIKHFLNTASPEYSKLNLDDKSKDILEVFTLIAENNSVLRRPIVRSIRLITVGCDKKKIAEMLQISQFNGQQNDESKGNLKNSKYVTRRTTTRSSTTKPVTSSVRAAK